MVIKVYISGISASKEVKKRQQRALLILDSLKVDYKAIDITEPGNEEERDHFKEVCKKKDTESIAHPPQFFNEDKYCGDWDDFFTASDDDTVLTFLGIEAPKNQGETLITNEATNGSLENGHHDDKMSEEPTLPDEGIIVDATQVAQESQEHEPSPPNEEVKEEEEIEVLATRVEDEPPADVDIEAQDSPEPASEDLITDVEEPIVEKEDDEDDEEEE